MRSELPSMNENRLGKTDFKNSALCLVWAPYAELSKLRTLTFGAPVKTATAEWPPLKPTSQYSDTPADRTTWSSASSCTGRRYP